MKPGRKALFEIRKFQNPIDLLLPRASFVCLVREILYTYKDDARILAAMVRSEERRVGKECEMRMFEWS